MSIVPLIKKNRLRLEEALRDSPHRWRLSSARWLLRTTIVDLLRQHVRGDVLDVGCGQMPFRRFLKDRFTSYDGLDFDRRSPDTKYIADAQRMSEVPDESYDTVLSVSVLEHLAEPTKAVAEMARVCRAGGQIVICTPFLARFHEEPHDYFRYTHHALAMFARKQGLDVEMILPYGGLFTFVSHQLSTVLVALTWGWPGLRWVFFWLNHLLLVVPALTLDRWVRFGGTMPLGHFCVFRKPPAQSREASVPDRPMTPPWPGP